ncbi:MAG: HEAT repeat domain-containing protein [Planctomycetota bacterium]|jgi:HEAT repeat protein
MISKKATKITLAAGAAAATVAQADSAAIDNAFKILKTYDWGSDRNALKPIDRAITAAQGNAAALKPLEKGLVDALTSGISRSAQDYVCRKLRLIGTENCVVALTKLLLGKETSHIARYALERIPDERSAVALRKALPNVPDKLKVGIISSLGTRRDEKSIATFARLLGDSDIQIAKTAAQSLGIIGTPAAAKELSKFAKKSPENMKMAVGDACLACAERLVADGKRRDAMALYQMLRGKDQPKRIQAAATKGMLSLGTMR